MNKYRKVTIGIFPKHIRSHSTSKYNLISMDKAFIVNQFDVRRNLESVVKDWISVWESSNPDRPYELKYLAFPEHTWKDYNHQTRVTTYHTNWVSLDWNRYPFVIDLNLFKDPYD